MLRCGRFVEAFLGIHLPKGRVDYSIKRPRCFICDRDWPLEGGLASVLHTFESQNCTCLCIQRLLCESNFASKEVCHPLRIQSNGILIPYSDNLTLALVSKILLVEVVGKP